MTQDTERRDSIPEEDGEGQGHLRQMKPIYEVDKLAIKKFEDDGADADAAADTAVKSIEMVAIDSISDEMPENSNDEKLIVEEK